MRVIARPVARQASLRRIAGSAGHLGYIDGARAVAALYVVLQHCYQWIWQGRVISARDWWLVGWLNYGHYAVSAFIAISGFSLMLPVVREDGRLPGGARTFFKRRARRILPPYYLAIGAALLLDWLLIGTPSGTPWDMTLPITARGIITHLLLIHNFDAANVLTINGVFWSIPVEWQIYFLFPILVWLAYRLGALRVLLGALAIALVVFVGLTHFSGAALSLLPAYWAHKLGYLPSRVTGVVDYAGLFALGMLAAVIAYSQRPFWLRLRTRVPWQLASAVMAILLVGVLLQDGRRLGLWGGLLVDVMTALLTALLFITAASSATSVPARILGSRPLTFVGNYAYSVYLVHAPILAVVYSYLVYPHLLVAWQLSPVKSTAVLIAVAFPLVIVTTYVFFLACERPFLNRRSLPRRPAPAAEHMRVGGDAAAPRGSHPSPARVTEVGATVASGRVSHVDAGGSHPTSTSSRDDVD